MTSINPSWPASWTATDISATSVDDASSASTSAISNDDKIATEVSLEVTYGTTADEGVKIYILRDVDGTDFENPNDNPWGFQMPYTTSTTHRRTFNVPAERTSKFKVHISNDSGAAVTATIRYKQATIETG